MPMENKIDSMSSFVQYILKELCGENYMSVNTRSPDHRYILGNRRWMKKWEIHFCHFKITPAHILKWKMATKIIYPFKITCFPPFLLLSLSFSPTFYPYSLPPVSLHIPTPPFSFPLSAGKKKKLNSCD